jgi:serine/threonine protein kinase
MGERRNERFGRYEILAELGRGAMGVVYKARDPKINRVVAVKTISLAGQPPEEEQEYRERFYREAEAAGRLSHPGIVTIFDVGEEPETRAPYIVMEFVKGQSLDKLLSREDRRLPVDTALQLAHELAEALDCAHGQGVVHRDLKPANILLTQEGHAKIADFGVAKLNLANHTLGGRTLGTPAYMSPEQLNGEAVDGRSDLFSLGVVLYTILTGYRPFQGNSALTVSYKVVNRDPVPATVLETELPLELDYIIGRAMAKDPAQRYQRGMEMALDIQDLREGREPWSKAKQHAAADGGVGAITAEKDKSSATGHRGAGVRSRLPQRVKSTAKSSAKTLLDKVGNKYVAGTLLLMGLLAFGLQVGHVVWPRLPARSGAGKNIPGKPGLGKPVAAPLPIAGELPGGPAAVSPARSVSAKAGTRSSLNQGSPSQGSLSQGSPRRSSSSLSSAGMNSGASAATLDVEVDYKFAEAHLSIWVDGQLSYTHALEGTDKKHLVVFHHVEGHQIHAMQIPPGKHLLRVMVNAGANSSDQSVTGDFSRGSEKLLRISVDARGTMSLNLE